jgi:hypothetical protein
MLDAFNHTSIGTRKLWTQQLDQAVSTSTKPSFWPQLKQFALQPSNLQPYRRDGRIQGFAHSTGAKSHGKSLN